LAPAKNLECGLAAIDHGADAVYIGAQRFGARAAAGNSVADIRQLCSYAHLYGAKVYVTVNTIVYDDELPATRQLLAELRQAQVDAVLVQDMALLSLCPGLPLHASTQTDNRTAEKVGWLRSLGFRRVVLARELSIDEIAEIHRLEPDVELEVFVHGALCVSYSGLCYASQHCFGRSANRGECAQFCRMKFDLVDADGRLVEHDRYLLSLKDMCQLDNLERLAEAGATSFKIEGRLKDVAYVKNVTAAYSERLNQIVRQHPDRYCRASRGRVTYTFTPDLAKTFNRGYTTYFAPGRQPAIASFDTPKAVGEYVGYVKEIRDHSFTVAGTASFANGDGLCFVNGERELEGFRVNRADRNRLYPLKMPAHLRPGTPLYRNNDQEFERLMARPSAERKIPVAMSLSPTADGFALTVDGATVALPCEHQRAQKSQRDNIVRQLSRLGGTPYECDDVTLPDGFDYFIPSSILSQLRRLAVEQLQQQSGAAEEAAASSPSAPLAPPSYPVPYLYNIANAEARRFYQSQGLQPVAPAFECQAPTGEALLMQCRHCLRFSLGYCVQHGGRRPAWREPLMLQLGDGRRFRLEFDCKHCQMNVLASSNWNTETQRHRDEWPRRE
jgi:putative protease